MYSEVNISGLNLCWVVKCKCQRPQHKCRRSKALLHLENVSKKLVYKGLFVLDVSMRGCRHLPVSKCSALPSAAVFLKNEPLASSYEGIRFPICLCSDPDWSAVFNTTHKRDERRWWAAQAGCREPIKLSEFTSCHRTIPDTGPPAPSTPGSRKGH